jgi:hypothetical protein
MDETTVRFQVSPDVVTRDIDDGLLLVNLTTGLTWRLNQVGAVVCRRLDGATDTVAIVADLERQFDGVTAETLRSDVHALLNELRQQGLVEPVTG